MSRLHKSSSGQAILLVLLLLILVGTLSGVLLHIVRNSLDTTSVVSRTAEIHYMTESGVEFARHELSFGDWLERDLPFETQLKLKEGQSEELRHVDITVERMANEGTDKRIAPLPVLKITCTGQIGDRHETMVVYFTDPKNLWAYLWNIHDYDFEHQSFRNSTIDFGDGGIGAPGNIEEVITVPDNGQVVLAAVSDPAFGAIIPSTVAIRDAEGRRLEMITELIGPQQESPKSNSQATSPQDIVIDYINGNLLFPTSMKDKQIVIRYDYYHRVPRPPGPFTFRLPYPKVQLRSELVANISGTPFFANLVLPRMQNHYLMDYETGATYFSEHNAHQPIRIDYAYMGTRMTGPIRINGNVRWSQRNLLYLLSEKNEGIEVSGQYEYEPQAKVFVTADRSDAVEVTQKPSRHYREGASLHIPPKVDLHFYRRMADTARGGDGTYIDNPDAKQDLTEAKLEWQRISGNHWSGRQYQPPGARIDLGTMILPPNGLIFAEGNLILTGTSPVAKRLTIVSSGIVYLESLPHDGIGSLALIARDAVCVNASARPIEQLGGITNVALNALIYAERGPFAVVAPITSIDPSVHWQLTFNGAISENEHYPNIEWARAFGRIEWKYDARHRDYTKRPPWLSCMLVDDPADPRSQRGGQ